MPEAICCRGRHGNDVIHMRTTVSPPCVLQLASLRSEVLKRFARGFVKQYAVVMETCNHHGNDIIGIHTKFHLYACYHWKVGEVKK